MNQVAEIIGIVISLHISDGDNQISLSLNF